MLTESTYKVARVHSEMVREWNRKNREHRIEEILSSL